MRMRKRNIAQRPLLREFDMFLFKFFLKYERQVMTTLLRGKIINRYRKSVKIAYSVSCFDHPEK